jgi:hypothetical protein
MPALYDPNNPLYNFGEKPKPAPPRDLTPLAEKAKLYATMKEQADAISGVVSDLAKEIAAWFPEEPGEHSQVLADGMVVQVKRSENWTWDSEKLLALFASVPLPVHVKVKYSVSKREFLRLTEAEQKELISALTRGLGSPRVTVTLGATSAASAGGMIVEAA